jgi:hypothetical protein
LQGQWNVNIISTKDTRSIKKPCARKLRRKDFGVQGKVILKKKGRKHDDLCKGKRQGNS